MRVLLTSQAGSGHWRPLLPLALAMAEAGHEVAVATTPVACSAISRFGIRCFPVGADEWLDQAPESAHGVPARPAATVWVELFVAVRARRALPDLLAVAEAWRPDLIVRESTEFAGCIAAERLGLPHAAVQVGAWRPALHRLIAPGLDRLRAEVGLPPDPGATALFRYLLLTPFPPGFHDPAQTLPPTARPMQYVPFDEEPGEEERLPGGLEALGGKPIVYATLGTAYNRTPGVIPAILAGLHAEPIALVLTVGPDQDPAALGPQPPHVHVARYLPQSRLFPRCDAVVCHGGFGTVLTALREGVPLVILAIAADQPETARRCAELGAAAVIGAEARTPAAIRDAVRAVLGEPRYRRSAARLGGEIRLLPAPASAVGLLEGLAATRPPLVPSPGRTS